MEKIRKNRVELIDYMGSDKLHGLAAWTSTFAEFDMELPEDIEDRVDVIVDHILKNSKRMRSLESLLGFLCESQPMHESPFRMSGFIFAMETDIATHIHKLKHTVILEAENGESARYKELKDKFYLPEDWKGIKPTNEMVIDQFGRNADWYSVLETNTNFNNLLYHEALKDLAGPLGKKRAKESARYFKGYNNSINTMNKFSFAGIAQFHYKRGNPDVAQVEIADIANQMLAAVKAIPGNPFELSLKAFKL